VIAFDALGAQRVASLVAETKGAAKAPTAAPKAQATKKQP
jgi:hypothetical protein